jgi:nucleotide-binding universal stress UspA family protein
MKNLKKTVLVGIDYTRSSQNAVKYAAMLATKHGHSLTLFHVFDIPLVNTYSGTFFISYPDLELSNQLKLNKYAAKLNKEYPGIDIKCFVTADSVKSTLQNINRKQDVFCVVIGLETKTRMAKFIYGTTGTDIAGRINSPVIIVPQSYTKHKLDKAVVAVDNEKSIHKNIINTCNTLKSAFKLKMQYLHVRTPDEILTDKKNTTKGITVKQIEAEDLQSGLASYNKQNKTDLTIIISHKHSALYRFFIETNTKTIAVQSGIPVLAIPK